jgi:hypothetical protein
MPFSLPVPTILPLVAPLAAHAEVIDRVVASVDETLITASDVRLESSMARWDGSPSPYWRDGDPLQRAIDAALVRRLAGDVALYLPSDAEVETRAIAMRDRVNEADPSGRAWADVLADGGIDEPGLRGAIRRRIVVERYLVRTISAPSSDVEGWLRACDATIARARRRFRIRVIAVESL